MAGITSVAADPPEPDSPATAPRPGLSVVAGTDAAPEAEPDENVLSPEALARLTAAHRHRIAAFIHNTLADLEDLEELG